MRWLRARLDRYAPHFERGGRFHKFHPLWEAADTFFYAPGSVTGTAAHVRDAVDLKRIMCGPGPMTKAVIQMLLDLGVDRENILLDDFG